MPTYQYCCNDCGHQFEEFQSITDDPLTVCPVCGGKVRRLISGGAGFLLKGHGFYQTDYPSKDYREKARKDRDYNSSSTSSKSDSGKSGTSGSKTG